MNRAPIKKYFTAQLAWLYGIEFKDMYAKLRELTPVMGEKEKGAPWSIKEVTYIFYKLGVPEDIKLPSRGRKQTRIKDGKRIQQRRQTNVRP